MRTADEKLQEMIDDARELERFSAEGKDVDEIQEAVRTVDGALTALSDFLGVPRSLRLHQDIDGLLGMHLVHGFDPDLVKQWDDLQRQFFSLASALAREGFALDFQDGKWAALDACDAETVRKLLQKSTNKVYRACEEIGYDPTSGFDYDELVRSINDSPSFDKLSAAMDENAFESFMAAHRVSYPSAVEALRHVDAAAAVRFAADEYPRFAVCNVGSSLPRRSWDDVDRLALASAVSSIASERGLDPIDVPAALEGEDAALRLGLTAEELEVARSAPQAVQEALDSMREQMSGQAGAEGKPLDAKTLLADLKKHVESRISGRGGVECPLGSVEACAAKIEELCGEGGIEEFQTMRSLHRTLSAWNSAMHGPRLVDPGRFGQSTGAR